MKAISAGNYATIHVALDENTESQSPILQALTEHLKKGGVLSIENSGIGEGKTQNNSEGLESWSKRQDLQSIRTDNCVWGSSNQNTIEVYTNISKESLNNIVRNRCHASHKHTSKKKTSGLLNDKGKQLSGEYTEKWVEALAEAHHHSWIQKQIPRITLKKVFIMLAKTRG